MALPIALPWVAVTETAPDVERDALVEILLEKGVIDEADVRAVEEAHILQSRAQIAF